MLIVSLQDPNLFSQHLKTQGADAIELRVDLCTHCSIESLTDFRNKLNLPLIVTLKPKHLESQLCLINDLRPDFIDIDFSLFHFLLPRVKSIFPDAKIIVSKHTRHFYETASFFKQFLQADFKKLVIETEDPYIGLKVAYLAKKDQRILFASGINTQFSRFFSYWQYCYLKEPTGKGQFSFDELSKLYRWEKPLEAFYALIGNPISHSPSHITHNTILDHLNSNACYLKIPVFSRHLDKTFQILKKLNCLGLSITTPLKSFLPKIYQKNRSLNTYNTFCFKKNQAINTDIETLIDFLFLNQINQVLILGNGACARAFKKALDAKGLSLYLWNRRNGFTTTKPLEVQCIINATSSPDPLKELPTFKFLVNLYHKEKAPYIEKRARNLNAILLTGTEFFKKQALKQFEFWGFDLDTFPSF